MIRLSIIKAYNEDIIRRCLDIRKAVFIEEKNVPHEIEVDRYDCINGECCHFLIQYKENDVGAFRCLDVSENTVRLQRLCVLKEYRSMGIGKAAINYMENYFKMNGKTKIVLDAKFSVRGFYEKCGYKKISDIFIEAGIEHIKMAKNI